MAQAVGELGEVAFEVGEIEHRWGGISEIDATSGLAAGPLLG
jgi:hypothetical protein